MLQDRVDALFRDTGQLPTVGQQGARMATYCYGHACWSLLLLLLISETRRRETANDKTNDTMPLQKDREDALAWGNISFIGNGQHINTLDDRTCNNLLES